MTPAERRALEILRDHGRMRPGEFALVMWPDAEGWKRSGKCGNNGSTKGVGMRLAGGAYLGKLQKKGLARYWKDGHEITQSGRDALR